MSRQAITTLRTLPAFTVAMLWAFVSWRLAVAAFGGYMVGLAVGLLTQDDPS